MTCNTSAVAVCCSSASRVSVISRAFSIAMTACAAKFSHQRYLFFGKRPHLATSGGDHSKEHTISTQRNAEQCAGSLKLGRASRN